MKGTPPRNSFSFSGCANGGKAGAPPPVQPRTLALAGAQEIPTEPSEHRIRLGRGPCGRKPPLQRVEKKHSASSQVHRLRTTQPKHRPFTRRSDRQITLRPGPPSHTGTVRPRQSIRRLFPDATATSSFLEDLAGAFFSKKRSGTGRQGIWGALAARLMGASLPQGWSKRLGPEHKRRPARRPRRPLRPLL